MTIEEFNNLNKQEKTTLIFDAVKVAERSDAFSKFELFSISSFFVETKTSKLYLHKRVVTTYNLQDLPFIYTGCLDSFWNK